MNEEMEPLRLSPNRLRWGLAHLAYLAGEIHTTDAKLDEDKRDGFDYRQTIEDQGVYLIPEGDNELCVDYGDTCSGGQPIELPLDPLSDIIVIMSTLKTQLLSWLSRTETAPITAPNRKPNQAAIADRTAVPIPIIGWLTKEGNILTTLEEVRQYNHDFNNSINVYDAIISYEDAENWFKQHPQQS